MGFHWSLSDSKSPQVSRTRLSILAVRSNAVFWVVSTRLLTSKSSRPFNNPLVTVPNAPITIGTIVTFMFHSFYYYYYYYYLQFIQCFLDFALPLKKLFTVRLRSPNILNMNVLPITEHWITYYQNTIQIFFGFFRW